MTLDPQTIINHALYPIDEISNPKRESIVDSVRAQLADDGCAVIRDFFSRQGLVELLLEANQRKSQAYYSPSKHCNVYLNNGDPSFPGDHPVNVFLPRSNGFVTADLFADDSSSRQLYHWQPLKRFLADCLQKTELYIYEDPVSNMIVNVGKPGQQFNWHFDTNEFTITMLLQAASDGGIFEYVPALRSAEDECYTEVKSVLEGDRRRVRQLELYPGDLQFFLGRFALHQVTENTGDSDRLLLIMSFAERPGMVGGMTRVKDLYGKITELHRAKPVRADQLID